MSEALSSSEIEDVLSSIRRLVSDDLRPKPGAAAPAAATDKLILTPALRVVDTAEVRPPAPPDFDAVMASVTAAVGPGMDPWESETGDQPPLADAPTAVDWQVPEGETAEFTVDDGFDRGPAPVVSAEDHLTAPEDPAPVLASAEDTPLPGWAQVSPEVEEDTPPAPPDAVTGTVEPDPRWADAAEAEVLRELHDSPSAAEEDDFPVGDTDRDLPYDEDVLREIVRDIIREEFQGRMGERITRNIRKLVRAEIARVLASEKLT